MFDHAVALLEVGHDLDDLVNTVVGGQVSGTDVDLNVVVKEVRGQLTDLLGPGGGPHASLTVRANLANDLTDLRLETHVQHTVSLVKDQVGNTTKVGAASLQHVDQTTGSGNADLNTAGEVTDLRTLGNTTVNTGVANTGGLSELGDLGLNLNSQLTSGSQDQDNGTISGAQKGLGVDVDNGGKTVGESLSGTSLGNTDSIATREGHGPTLGLDGSGTLETLRLDLTQNVLRETSLVEGLNGARDVTTLHSHVVGLAVLIDLAVGASSNIRVLLVEGLLELGEVVQV